MNEAKPVSLNPRVSKQNDIQPNGRWASFPKLRYKSKPTSEWEPVEATLSLAFLSSRVASVPTETKW